MNIQCFNCYKFFIPGERNTKIIGPYVDITCPYCNSAYYDKLLNFVEAQLGGYNPHCHIEAIWMIRLAEFVELNSSDYYRKRGLRHGGKKKVRDVRN